MPPRLTLQLGEAPRLLTGYRLTNGRVENLLASGERTTSNVLADLAPVDALARANRHFRILKAFSKYWPIQKLDIIRQRFQALRRHSVDEFLDFAAKFSGGHMAIIARLALPTNGSHETGQIPATFAVCGRGLPSRLGVFFAPWRARHELVECFVRDPLPSLFVNPQLLPPTHFLSPYSPVTIPPIISLKLSHHFC